MMRILRGRILKLLSGLLLGCAPVYAGTVTGPMVSQNGAPIKNATIGFALAQAGLVIGSGSVVPITTACYTSTDGTVVGIANPLLAPSVSSSTTGGLPAGNYYAQLTAYATDGHETLPGPEVVISLPTGGSFTLTYRDPLPSGYAAGVKAYVATSSGAETQQGVTTGGAGAYTQTVALVSGAAEPTSNSTICSIAFNDTIIPYSGYSVSLTSSTGDAYPGFPQKWQLNGGLNGTVNISQGAPLWNGVIIYPQPIVAQPLNHGPQSISGPLGMSGYDIFGVGALGIGTNTPAYPLDVENGFANFADGILLNGLGGTSGQCVGSDGTSGRTWINCLTSLGTIFYQHAQSNAAAVTQRATFNLVPPLVAADNSGASRTDFSVSTTGNGTKVVTEGTTAGTSTHLAAYDGAGNLQPSSLDPTAIPQARGLTITTQCTGGGTDNCICTPGSANSFDECTVNIAFGTAFPTALDGATANCDSNPTGSPSTNGANVCSVIGGNASGVTVQIQQVAARIASITHLYITAVGH